MLGFINLVTINFPSSPSLLPFSSPLSSDPSLCSPSLCLPTALSTIARLMSLLSSEETLSKTSGHRRENSDRWHQISCFGFHWSSSPPQEPSPLVAPHSAGAGWPAASDRGADACTFAPGIWCQHLLTLTHFATASALWKLQALNLEASEKKFTTRIGQENWEYVHPTLRVKGCPIFRDSLVLTT